MSAPPTRSPTAPHDPNDPPAPLEPGAAGAVAAARGVTHAMAVSVSQIGSSEVMGVDAAQAAKVVLLRADESPLPPSRLFDAITSIQYGTTNDPHNWISTVPVKEQAASTIA